ncbi:winged helix-turn-helix transcriptional regulator [Tistrella bauzanensis]
MLEEHGIIYRHHVPSIPPEVSYGLTGQGQELGDVFDALESVSRRWMARDWPESTRRPVPFASDSD